MPLTLDQVQELIAEGHQIIPSKWVDVDKAQYKKGRDLVCCWCAAHEVGLHSADVTSADVTSAYFQGRPLDRVLMMRQQDFQGLRKGLFF